MKNLGYAVAACALISAPASAQSPDYFRDSWFWGAKAGAVNLGTGDAESEMRPSIGLEWLVTRTLGALYLSADYTNVEMLGSVDDPSATNGRRLVRFNNLRRIGFAALAFPRTFGPVRPYGGVGFSMNVIARAEALVDTVNATTPSSAAIVNADEARSRSAIQGIAGVQAQFGRLAPFAQLTFLPSSSRFLIRDHSLQFFEAGLRYNFGAARDRRGRGR